MACTLILVKSKVIFRNIAPRMSVLGATKAPEHVAPSPFASRVSQDYAKYSPAEAVKLVITVKDRRTVRNTIILHCALMELVSHCITS